jgi:hypothetical protein
MNYITTKPFSRNNEDWADNTIDCSPPGQQIQHAWISEPQRPGKWLLYQEEFYKKIVDFLLEDENSPWMFERLECYIFNNKYKIK